MNRLAILLPVCLVLAAPASARPPYRRVLVDLLELPASSRLNDCRVCHLPPVAGQDETALPHNAFGTRLATLRATLRKAGKPFDVATRLLAVRDEDADGDGVANLVELLAGTFPADATDRPDAPRIVQARKRLTTLLASLEGYRWRPFERVVRPLVPAVAPGTSANNPIDAFLAVEQQRRGLTPRPEASRAVLLRRLYLDLLGLPPTPEELHAFENDPSPSAYEKVVERVLASPRHGERWGRHWMDVWRYSDWAGFGAQIRDSQPHIWHWRDWIIESLNGDRSYDRMILEMLAADELAPTDSDALRATGFLVRNYKLLSREKWLQDAVDHTGQAFLGITLGCARCHDHMFDAITQREYYQVRAIFTPHGVRTDRLPGWPDVKANGLPRVYDASPEALTHLLIRGDDRTPEKKPLPPGVPDSLGGSFAVTPVSLPTEAREPDNRPFVVRETLAASKSDAEGAAAGVRTARWRVAVAALGLVRPGHALSGLVALERSTEALSTAEREEELARARYDSLEAVLRAESLERAGKKDAPAWTRTAQAATRSQRLVAVLEARKTLQAARLAERFAPKARRAALAKKVATAMQALMRAAMLHRAPPSTSYTRRTVRTYPATSTGRRLALARWIASRDNPLAARVAVNHIWLRHLGQGIVPSVFDFGRNGQPATHPALLDWLAVEFMESGWSMKHLHRLIVTSAAYRRSSTPTTPNLTSDPDNTYLWRFAPRRIEAEVVRDTIFHLASKLDGTMGGPDIPHAQGMSIPRRSLYFQHAAEKQMEFLRIFDTASVTECYQRKQAIMPQQALALINNDLVVQHARLVSGELHPGRDDAAFVRAAFEKILSRTPTAEEQTACMGFLAERRTPRARENLVLVLFNHHEFMTLR